MKFTLIVLTILFGLYSPIHAKNKRAYITNSATGYVSVKSYKKKSGKLVMSHRRSKSNSLKADNWSRKGNVNPFTGKKGYKK